MEGASVATYLIGYDLNRPGKDYPRLFDAIKESFAFWWRRLNSTWIVKTELSSQLILARHVGKDDEQLVVGLTDEGAWTGFSTENSQWLKNNL